MYAMYAVYIYIYIHTHIYHILYPKVAACPAMLHAAMLARTCGALAGVLNGCAGREETQA